MADEWVRKEPYTVSKRLCRVSEDNQVSQDCPLDPRLCRVSEDNQVSQDCPLDPRLQLPTDRSAMFRCRKGQCTSAQQRISEEQTGRVTHSLLITLPCVTFWTVSPLRLLS
jgi:hypothetical protein